VTSGRRRQPTNSAYTVNTADAAAAAAAATANGSTVAYACACACQTVLPRPLLYCILIVQKYAVSRLPVDHRRRGKRDFFGWGGGTSLPDKCQLHVSTVCLHCALAATQCIVIGSVCGFVCVCECYHDNSKLRASILTKLCL